MVRTVLLRYLGTYFEKKKYLKLAILMHSNSIARHFSPMFHAKSLLPRLDKLLPVRN